MMPVLRRSLFLLGCLLAISCNSDSPYYRVQFSMPDTVSLSPGESTQFDLTLDRVADQPGELRVDLVGAPQGITLLPQVVLPEGSESITVPVTVSVAQDIQVSGTQTTTLQAKDSGKDLISTATLFVVVLPPPTPAEGFSITTEDRTLDVFPGQNQLATIQVARTSGFTGALTLTLESSSRRILAKPLVVPAEQTSARFLIQTTDSATRLPQPITVIATSEDGRQAKLALTINVR
ncbi:hypothetical protein MYSTI_01392 [Myxococcus stipitatus DSM 14675]|uniref:Lipoprotein n=1 Tax=Myxococcus stipitatus (strain DSM 14675 / JCM 12634 / Mx s8) TaxID=1278073 RepID=L7U4F0_MYXSD|nr:hypothetical protein [Myxococcus stipitatus]AGC42740.1 hypothetical protein MYSTI_01392 [Myxococcus stipitatus DSM 14675]